MVAMGTIGWSVFARELIGSRWFPEYDLPDTTIWVMGGGLLSAGLAFQTLLEWKGKKVVGLSVLLGGVLPLMIGIVLAASGDEFAAIAVWLVGAFPGAWPFYAGHVIVPTYEMPMAVARATPLAFSFWVGVGILLSGWLVMKLSRYRQEVAAKCE
jgi:succinate-acetate transporter protein